MAAGRPARRLPRRTTRPYEAPSPGGFARPQSSPSRSARARVLEQKLPRSLARACALRCNSAANTPSGPSARPKHASPMCSMLENASSRLKCVCDSRLRLPTAAVVIPTMMSSESLKAEPTARSTIVFQRTIAHKATASSGHRTSSRTAAKALPSAHRAATCASARARPWCRKPNQQKHECQSRHLRVQRRSRRREATSSAVPR